MKSDTKEILIYFFAILTILIFLSMMIPKKAIVEETRKQYSFISNENSTFVSLQVPAIDEEGEGVPVYLNIEASKGSGKTLVEIENLLFWADTQHSIRMARIIAGNITKKDLSEYDLVYSVDAKASIVGGPSAGAALTIATIFALEGEKPREDVMITGSINHDGTLGPVSSILEKAKASKKANATIFIVPLLQSRNIIYEEEKHCQKFGYSEICTTETIPKEVNLTKEADLEIVEVKTIEEAVPYFKS